ncbi:uncharacterized protein LOC110270204 isoform X2 [Arachis ipaensis]|uniref:uncharacterized protein n=1 Tax=Arachis hypogaea TaxID=3818 RepID=UPI000A2B760E|nr:uncharacterized protein LOC110270204 isoform X2 [Arachis ipaensis]XP_025644677.1 uncharacterized protein LOC112738428 isoform X2 [Arachis hypogaea]
MIRIIKVHLQLAILLPHQFRVLFHLLLVHLYTNPYQEPTLLHLLASQIPLDTLIPAFQFPVLPKGFKCLNATGKVYIARNVLFDESSMFPSLNTNCSTASSVSTSFIPQIPQIQIGQVILEGRRSTSGYCLYFGCNPILWSSRKQKSV